MHSFRSSSRAHILVRVLLAVAVLAAGAMASGCWLLPKPGGPVTSGSETTSATLDTTPQVPPTSTSTTQLHTRPTPPSSTAGLPSKTPEDAVRAWYLAWFAGDMDAAKRTSTASFAGDISEHTFEGGDAWEYKILGTEGAAGKLAFYVRETRQDAPPTDMTVFVVADDSGNGYLVNGYEDTPAGTVPASPASPDSAAVVPKDAAQTAVTALLQALQKDDVAGAKALTTARFAKANPSFFAPASGALTEFPIDSVVRRHDVWVAHVAEKWAGESETLWVNIVVETLNGSAKIDRVQGWY